MMYLHSHTTEGSSQNYYDKFWFFYEPQRELFTSKNLDNSFCNLITPKIFKTTCYGVLSNWFSSPLFKSRKLNVFHFLSAQQVDLLRFLPTKKIGIFENWIFSFIKFTQWWIQKRKEGNFPFLDEKKNTTKIEFFTQFLDVRAK